MISHNGYKLKIKLKSEKIQVSHRYYKIYLEQVVNQMSKD